MNDVEVQIIPNWKEVAVRKYEEMKRVEREALERQEAEANMEFAQGLKRALAAVGIEAEPTGKTIEIDGVTFGVANPRHHPQLSVIQSCSACGSIVDVRYVQSLVEIGEFITAHPKPEKCWNCRSTTASVQGSSLPEESTPLQRLGQALLDYIGSYGYVRGGE